MTERDPAFLWETEALRSSAPRATEDRPDTGAPVVAEGQWVTLRQASRSTGIPVETLRKWARRATIATYLTPAPSGTNIRMVDLESIEQRAAELGRPIDPIVASHVEPARPDTFRQPTEPEPTAAPATDPVPDTSTPPPQPPPGTMIVPVDAWNKMLNQLGNLHEAGQHLAEARERAAKAETESRFLRERLAEMRQQHAPPAPPAVPPPATAPAAAPVAEEGNDPVEPPEKVWNYLLRRIRDRGLG